MKACDFTIRVYAALINEFDEVLLMNESYRGISFTKFPGGGLEWGEGVLDCIKRELHEELGIEKIDLEQLYTTDFFVNSYFDTNVQVLSIYYKSREAVIKDSIKIDLAENRLDSLKWVPIKDLSERDVTFPIDKKVVKLLTGKLKV